MRQMLMKRSMTRAIRRFIVSGVNVGLEFESSRDVIILLDSKQ